MYSTKWITCPKRQPDAKMRMFCFSYAGGGASVFLNWPHSISNDIEVCIIKMPGREVRFNEPPYRRITKLVEDLAPAILPFLDKPFIFFGHSLGAHIGFYLTRHLRKSNLPCPIHMFISAARAPHLTEPIHDALHYKMEDKEFIDKLIKLGGMAEEVLKDKEILDIVLPILRADIEMLNTMEFKEEEPLSCGMTVLYGEFDNRVSREDAEAWSTHTNHDFRLTMITGKHLFINTHQAQIIELINHESLSLN
ncbi:MAG: thioesterase [Deltaproteobacteria bacterium]|nr:thioesterase [Deltaproteobacteria bacterium]